MFSKHSFAVADELSTPDDKTMFSHTAFTTGDSSTVLQIFSVGILRIVSLVDFASECYLSYLDNMNKVVTRAYKSTSGFYRNKKHLLLQLTS